jgi:hypothetical protein
MFFIRWIISFFYTYEDPISDIGVHGSDNGKPGSVKVKEEIIDIESIKFKAAFDKIQKYNILDTADFEYIKKCKNEKMMEYIRNIK